MPTAPKPNKSPTPKTSPKAKPPAAARAKADPAVTSEDGAAKSPVAMLRMKDLLAIVVAANDGKKNGVRQIVDATLAAIGEALHRGEQLNLPPLGRARVTRSQDSDGVKTMIIKLRRDPEDRAAKTASNEGLAEANDQG